MFDCTLVSILECTVYVEDPYITWERECNVPLKMFHKLQTCLLIQMMMMMMKT